MAQGLALFPTTGLERFVDLAKPYTMCKNGNLDLSLSAPRSQSASHLPSFLGVHPHTHQKNCNWGRRSACGLRIPQLGICLQVLGLAALTIWD